MPAAPHTQPDNPDAGGHGYLQSTSAMMGAAAVSTIKMTAPTVAGTLLQIAFLPRTGLNADWVPAGQSTVRYYRSKGRLLERLHPGQTVEVPPRTSAGLVAGLFRTACEIGAGGYFRQLWPAGRLLIAGNLARYSSQIGLNEIKVRGRRLCRRAPPATPHPCGLRTPRAAAAAAAAAAARAVCRLCCLPHVLSSACAAAAGRAADPSATSSRCLRLSATADAAVPAGCPGAPSRRDGFGGHARSSATC